MATIARPPLRPSVASPVAFTDEPRRIKPITWWAAIGGAVLALQVYVFSAWIISGDATRTDPGPSPLPTWMHWSIRLQETAGVIALVAILFFVVYRPWRRDGRISLDGMLVFCFLGVWWQDPLINYSQAVATYNTHLINFGSWTSKIPGWNTPNGHVFPEPVVWTSTCYMTAVWGAVVISNIIMRKAKERWPRLGVAGLVGICLGFFIVFDLAIELVWVRTGIYFYPGAIRSLSFFPGTYYQFPAYEVLLFGVTWGRWGCMRYFRDDKGRTLAERGVDDLRATPKQKSWLRFLALLGMLNVLYLWCNVGWQFFGLRSDAWPKSVTTKSYMLDQLCGPGTNYACSGPSVPIPRRGSDHLDSNGQLVRK